jgi:hypothetical protein
MENDRKRIKRSAKRPPSIEINRAPKRTPSSMRCRCPWKKSWRKVRFLIKPSSQTMRVLEMLRAARSEGRDVSVVDFCLAVIPAYNARIRQLRLLGYEILNYRRCGEGNTLRSTYALKFDPERDRR